jgi:hypothetical protein
MAQETPGLLRYQVEPSYSYVLIWWHPFTLPLCWNHLRHKKAASRGTAILPPLHSETFESVLAVSDSGALLYAISILGEIANHPKNKFPHIKISHKIMRLVKSKQLRWYSVCRDMSNEYWHQTLECCNNQLKPQMLSSFRWSRIMVSVFCSHLSFRQPSPQLPNTLEILLLQKLRYLLGHLISIVEWARALVDHLAFWSIPIMATLEALLYICRTAQNKTEPRPHHWRTVRDEETNVTK